MAQLSMADRVAKDWLDNARQDAENSAAGRRPRYYYKISADGQLNRRPTIRNLQRFSIDTKTDLPVDHFLKPGDRELKGADILEVVQSYQAENAARDAAKAAPAVVEATHAKRK